MEDGFKAQVTNPLPYIHDDNFNFISNRLSRNTHNY